MTRGQGPSAAPGVPFRDALRVWLRVAAYSFGGPAGQIAVMQTILVDEKRWMSQGRFLHALNYCMLLPGPEAQQLATYGGWLLHGWRGGLVAGGLFILPGFLSILALSFLYAGFRETAILEAVFYGLKPAVLAVVVAALLRLGRRALRNRLAIGLAATAFLAIYAFNVPFPLIIIGAAGTGLLGSRLWPSWMDATPDQESEDRIGSPHPPTWRRTWQTAALWLAIWWVPIALLVVLLGASDVLVAEAVFFSKTAVVTFGGAYAVLAYIAQMAVQVYGWLAPGEMLDGLGMAETTPGPLIQVVQFVGFMGAYRNPGPFAPLWAGVLGSLVTTWATFVPCFLWIFVGAPFIEHLRGRRSLAAAMAAITAAVVGVILNLAAWFGIHTLFRETRTVSELGTSLLIPVWTAVDPAGVAIAGLAFLALFRLRLGMLPVLGLSAVAGLAYRLLLAG